MGMMDFHMKKTLLFLRHAWFQEALTIGLESS